jgi:DNA-binding response OmpR family regulator
MLEELKAQYRQSLPDKITAIKLLLHELREGKGEAADKLRMLAHSLHGSGTTFGFPEVSRAAKQVEHADDSTLLKTLLELIRVLFDATKGANIPAKPAILIIDDDNDITYLLEALLSELCPEHQVLIAGSAAEAEPLLQTRTFALIVLDLVLPDGDGRQILRQLNQTGQPTTRAFVLSGVDKASIRDECLALGALLFIPKPFDPASIANIIAAELSVPTAQAAATSSTSAAAQPTRPAAPKPPPKPLSPVPTPAVVATASGMLPILVAEDDELLANVIKHRLSREGFKVSHVNNGTAAAKAAANQEFSLVILDVKMPMMDGFEVLTMIRTNPALVNLPVIMLTAMGSEKDVVRGYELGANDYMLKPFSPVALVAKVKSLLKLG